MEIRFRNSVEMAVRDRPAMFVRPSQHFLFFQHTLHIEAVAQGQFICLVLIFFSRIRSTEKACTEKQYKGRV